MQKEDLIKFLIEEGYLKTEPVIDAFRTVPRENFVPEQYKKFAYVNEPLPIAAGQTISQPLTVAAMTEALAPGKGMSILEVGSGSGYQAAILSMIAGPEGRVITTEIIQELYEFSKSNLMNYTNVTVINDDGASMRGKFDRIIVTASAPAIPNVLLDQLKDGGRMVIPVSDELLLIERNGKDFRKTFLGYYAFVPLTGVHGFKQ